MSNDEEDEDVRQSTEELVRLLQEASERLRNRSEQTRQMITEALDLIERIDSSIRTGPNPKDLRPKG
jgi:hypothetical protein